MLGQGRLDQGGLPRLPGTGYRYHGILADELPEDRCHVTFDHDAIVLCRAKLSIQFTIMTAAKIRERSNFVDRSGWRPEAGGLGGTREGSRSFWLSPLVAAACHLLADVMGGFILADGYPRFRAALTPVDL